MENSSNNKLDKILEVIERLESRISNLEKKQELHGIDSAPPVIEEVVQTVKEETFDQTIGTGWFAKLGIVVLLVGLLLFLKNPIGETIAYLPSVIGLFLAGIFYIGAVKISKTYTQVSGYLLGGALIIIYFSVLRLHFFGFEQVIASRLLILLLLLMVTGLHFYLAVRRKSIYFAVWSIVLGFLTSLISENHYLIFALIIVLSAVVVLLKIKMGWVNLLFFGIFFSNLTHLLWFINNPFLGNEISVVDLPWHIIMILIYSLIYAWGNLLIKENQSENYVVISVSFMNAILGYGLMFLSTLINPFEFSGYFHLVAAVAFISMAFLYWKKQQSALSTFIYAMIGYGALSFAIINLFTGADVFILLCWQSLLVVSTALWFRSKYIVICNFIIFVLLIISYLILVDDVSYNSISFGFVALITARILNWKKTSLKLQSEQMRNGYLITALLIIPYSLYQTLPANYVAYSWAAVAMIYYWMSNLLTNAKYRWMSVVTLLMTTIYVIIFGISSEDSTDRILAFVFVGILLLGMSLLFTKKEKVKIKL